jgi:hypothetical protein
VIAIEVLCPSASLGHFMVPFLDHVFHDDGVGTMAFGTTVLLPRLGFPFPIAPFFQQIE